MENKFEFIFKNGSLNKFILKDNNTSTLIFKPNGS